MQEAAGLCQPYRGRDGSPETLRAAVCGHRERARGPAPWVAVGPWLPPRCPPAPACSPGRGVLTAHRVRPVNHPAHEAGSPSSMTLERGDPATPPETAGATRQPRPGPPVQLPAFLFLSNSPNPHTAFIFQFLLKDNCLTISC